MGLSVVRNIKVHFYFAWSWWVFVFVCKKKDLLSASALKQKLACTQTKIAYFLSHRDLNDRTSVFWKPWYTLTHLMHCSICLSSSTEKYVLSPAFQTGNRTGEVKAYPALCRLGNCQAPKLHFLFNNKSTDRLLFYHIKIGYSNAFLYLWLYSRKLRLGGKWPPY